MNIEKNKVEKIDQNGNLIWAGFTWMEPNAERAKFRRTFMTYALWIGGIGFFFVFGAMGSVEPHKGPRWDQPLLLCLLAGLLGLSGLIISFLPYVLDRMVERNCAIFDGKNNEAVVNVKRIFKDDPHDINNLRGIGRITEISSIEMHPTKTYGGGQFKVENHPSVDDFNAFTVTIFFSSGAAHDVATTLREGDARIVTVQLNKALKSVLP